jgi:hypothetical protein
MEVLTEKLAELLQVGVDGAAKAYPVLRGQYIWYNVIGNIIATAGIIFFVGLVAALVSGVLTLLAHDDDDDAYKVAWSVCKKLAMICVIALAIWVTAEMVRVVVAPDIMMIMEML